MKQSFDHNDILRQVLEFLAKIDIVPYNESDIVISGKLIRFRTREDSPSETSGAIIIHTDGWPAGFAMDWRKGIREYWKYDISALSQEDRNYFNSDEYKKKCEEQERKAEAKRKAEKLKHSAEAAQFWKKLPNVPIFHMYIVRKNLCKIDDNTLLRYNPATMCLAVPLRNIFGQVLSIQWINDDGQKTFFTGASLDGAFWSCRLERMDQNPKGIILLGEGFATMVKVAQLTGYPVVAAMSCYQLEAIARILREKYPEATIIITADNDHQTEKKRGVNPGLLYATNAKKAPCSESPSLMKSSILSFSPMKTAQIGTTTL